MKITGTKKLSIILLSLACAAAAGLGVLFSGWSDKAPKAYTQPGASIMYGDEDAILKEFSNASGISAELLKFYAKANNGTVEMLYQYYLYDKETAKEEILSFLSAYSQCQIVDESGIDMSDEDWYVSPDDVSSYWNYVTMAPAGISDTWTTWYTSKAFTTTEKAYWRESNFQWGHMVINHNIGVGIGNVTSSEAGLASINNVYWDSLWVYDIVWLDEGEEYYYGIYSNKNYSSKYKGAMEASHFMEKYLVDRPYYVVSQQPQYYPHPSGTYVGVFRDLDADATTPLECTLGYDSPRKTINDWKDEFASNVKPFTSGTNGSLNNTNFTQWLTATDMAGAVGTGAGAGIHGLKLSKDAPSGMYFMTFYRPSGACWWNAGLATTSSNAVNICTNGYGVAWHCWGYTLNYGVLVCRKGVTAPDAEYGEGVSSDLRSRTVRYTGDEMSFTLTHDWGPGMTNITTEYWDEANSVWIPTNATFNLNPVWYDPAAPTTLLARSAAMTRGIAGCTKFVATHAGKYRITYTPFNLWTDGTNTPVEYFFTIKPMLMKPTSMIPEDGVNAAQTDKVVNSLGDQPDDPLLYVSLYPVIHYADSVPIADRWILYKTSVDTSNCLYGSCNHDLYLPYPGAHTESGVLTLAQKVQHVYTITVYIQTQFKTDIAWDDGTDYGSSNDLVFTFTIGPEKIVIPDIIKDASAGTINATSKEVTFNGAIQTMSFLPISRNQLNFRVLRFDTSATVFDETAGEPLYEWTGDDRIEYFEITTNTMILRALNAGKYMVILEVKPQYVFDDGSSIPQQTRVEFFLIIKEAEISSPWLNVKQSSEQPGSKIEGNTKIISYGGEKVIINNQEQDWVAELYFDNANEAQINFTATDGLGKKTWGDKNLVVAARSAGTYTVTFTPKKNYKWIVGEEPPVYTLIITKLVIDYPVIHKDDDTNEAKYEGRDKTIDFSESGAVRLFSLDFPSIESGEYKNSNITYTKKSSVYIVYNGSFNSEWSKEGSTVTYKALDAGTFYFTVTPTNNYCWPDGSSDDIVFTFKIIAIDLPALECHVGTEQVRYPDNGDKHFWINAQYSPGKSVTVEIGQDSDDYRLRYIEYDKSKENDDTYKGNIFDKLYSMLDANGVQISDTAAGVTVVYDKAGGKLKVTASEAGTYRIAIYIRNSNYKWAENGDTKMEYWLVIEAQSIKQPEYNETVTQGYSKEYTGELNTGTYTLNDVYRDMVVRFSATLDPAFASFVTGNKGDIKIIDPKGNTYVYTYCFDGAINEAKAALTEQRDADGNVIDYYLYYTYFNPDNFTFNFFAKNQGTYTWRVILGNTNYKWKTEAPSALEDPPLLYELTYTINIARASVSGIEMHYLGDDEENGLLGSNGALVGYKNVRGSDTEMDKASLYYTTTFSDKLKGMYFDTSTKVNNWEGDGGFAKQFVYTVNPFSAIESYDSNLLTKLNIEDNGYKFNENGLWLYALDAGTYEIVITPSYNFCWNDSLGTTGSVTFKLIIKQRKLDKPVIIDDQGNHNNTSLGEWKTEFNHAYQDYSLWLESYPQGYKAEAFKYFETEERGENDIEPTIIPNDGVTYIDGVKIDSTTGKGTLTAQAKSAGDYALIVTVSNPNNYYIAEGDLQYLYYINKLKVSLPSAYLAKETLDTAQSTALDRTYTEVTDGTIVVGEKFQSGTGYTVSAEYVGKYYAVYFHGSDVSNGDFNFSIIVKGNATVAPEHIIQPDDLLVDSSNPTDKAGYFRLTTMNVSEYTIRLTFTTPDFYWSTGTIDDTRSVPMDFNFVVTKNSLPIPKIYGSDYANLPLENDSYTAEFDYALDLASAFNTSNGAVPQSIEIRDMILGLPVASDPTLGVYRYSNITVAVSGEVYMAAPTPNTDNTGYNLMFTTADTTSGTATVDGGLVGHTYCITLSIDPNNSEWANGTSTDKIYYIKINPMKVKAPTLTNADVVSETQLSRSATYNGDIFAKALIISGYDKYYMGVYPGNIVKVGATKTDNVLLSSNLTLADVVVSDDDDSVRYGESAVLNAPAPADTYTVTVPLSDPDNMVWERDGSNAPIEFSFKVNPIKVAKTYIENSAKAKEVSGLTKTVTYSPGVTQYLEVGNYWFNPAVLTGTPAVSESNSATLPSVVPDVMNFSVANGTFSGISYQYDKYAIGDKYNSMLYNAFNNGLLRVEAVNAGTYVIKFSLTSNAVWADGSTDDISITLLVKKIEVPDLVIVNDDSEATVDGTVKTIKYRLDSSGNAVDRILKLQGYKDSLMQFVAASLPTDMTSDGIIDIASTGAQDGYSFRAQLSGSYTVTFQLLDGNNYRWSYANTDEIYFTLEVEKLELQDPAIFAGYKLVNEFIDNENRTLTVDYDLREHTIIIRSMFEALNNGLYSGLGAAHYFTVTPTTNDPSHVPVMKAYDSTQGLSVNSLFEILGTVGFTYDGPDAGKTVGAGAIVGAVLNAFALTAITPGEYVLTFHIVDDNMVWFNNGSPTANDIEFTLIIKKVIHEAPVLAAGETNAKEYEGEPIPFRITNTYNGIVDENDTVATTTVSEKYVIYNYDGDDTNVMANVTANPKYYEKSWYNGTLTLAFTSVGTYYVRVSITDTDNIEWTDGTTFKEFALTVMPRNLSVSITYQAPDDDEVNASLAAGATSWPISTKVQAVITVQGLRHVPGSSTVDNVLKFRIYFEISTALGTQIQPVDYSETLGGWMAVPQTDGTYNLVIIYNIPYGKGNIVKSSYRLHIVQDSAYAPGGAHSNYYIADPNTVFTVDADPAPFKTDMLEWYYTSSKYPMIDVPIQGIGGDAAHRFTNLEFEAGVTYTFKIKLNTQGMQGYQNTGAPFTDIHLALNSWKVQWDGNYSGTPSVTNAGNYSTWVMITALNPNEFAFANYRFELFYTIRKTQYDLSKLGWDYDGSTPFTFDGSNKSVNVTGMSDAQYSGLTILRYTTVGTFTSLQLNGNVYNGNVNQFNGNAYAYAGKYTTTVIFNVAPTSNYEKPDMANENSYKGTFSWSRTWEILPKEIEVYWVENTTSSSTGDVITKRSPAISGAHASKFTYAYEKWDDANSVWVSVTQITRQPNATLKYRAEAKLLSNPGSPNNDFARNYTFKVLGDNPLEFEVGGNDVEILNHIEINGMQDTEYEYTGQPFVASWPIDLDTTNGLINNPARMRITPVYYNRATGAQISGAPTEVGMYTVKLKLSYTDVTEDYTLAVDSFDFDIIKAKIRYSDFEWHVTHDDGNRTYEARYDVGQGKWINIDDNNEEELIYDGHAYVVTLWSEYASSVISFFYTDNNQINAGTYTATITPTLDGVHYEIVSTDPIPAGYSWTIEKQFLDLSKISWNYTKAYEFTLVNGNAKEFSVQIKDLPEYLLDKIDYTTVRAGDSMAMPNEIANAGKYKTKAEIDTAAINYSNYILDTWPTAVPSTLDWEIKAKQIPVPTSDLSWSEFDGVYHNLLGPLNLDVDWAEYFSIDVAYAQSETDVNGFVAYDGTANGGKYYALNAGIYRFTLKINGAYNDKDNNVYNIVWAVTDNSGSYTTDTDRTISYTVNKKSLKVIGWNNNYELSSVILEGGIDASKFVQYKFYEGANISGAEAQLNDILSSAGGDTYSITAEVKKSYEGNITLEFAEGMIYTTFVTKTIDATNAFEVGAKPFLFGYYIGGVWHKLTADELLLDEPFVIYTGETVEFKIYNWDDYYSKYLTVWNGSIDDLVQTEAGPYSITLILRSDLEKPLYWNIKDGKINRESVTLNFEIRYRMLTIPDLPQEVIYTGNEIDILSYVENADYATLLAEYGDYVDILNNKATDVDEMKLYLTIKEEYGTAVRWDNGTVNGLFGTITFVWKIKPILLYQPVKDVNNSGIEYDGTEHSVYEFLVGYDKDNMPQSILDLMKYVNETNGRSINAGAYTATLALPNSNYAWCNASGVELSDRTAVSINWNIIKKRIDFSTAYWGYYDEDGNAVAYNASEPFVYTVKNGVPQSYTVQIIGMPEILKLYASYTTNGASGNSASAVDSYTTRVVYDLNRLDTNNYEIVSQMTDELSSIAWEIVAREFEAPTFEDDKISTVFDGSIHEIAEMLKLQDDWAEYFKITVQYKDGEHIDGWEDYNGEDMLAAGYSNYNIYKVGMYLVTISLKNTDPVWIPGTNVKWSDAGEPVPVQIIVAERTVVVKGWNEENQYSTVLFEDTELPEEIKDKFEYIIYEDGYDERTPVSPEDVEGGKTYYIKFAIKSGNGANGMPYAYGINLQFLEGVVNPYEFGTYSFGTQSLLWMPRPVLETAVLEYNGQAQTFVIKGFEEYYKMTDEQRIQLNLGFDSSVTSFIYLQSANSLTATAAGEYTAVVKLLGKVYLSWYDSELYYTSDDHRTLYDKATGYAIPDAATTLYDNKSHTLTFRITPKKIPLLSDEDLETLLELVVEYRNTEKDVITDEKTREVFEALEKKYGKIFDYAGNTGTAAGIYELIISLADLDSCSWYLPDKSEKVEKHVGVEINGYKLHYVYEGGLWSIKLVKVDKDGNPVKDSSGRYSEYFDEDGEYTISAQFKPKYETDYFPIVDSEEKSIFGEDGKILPAYLQFFNNGKIVDGIFYEYFVDAEGEYVLYYLDESNHYQVADDEHPGTHIQRYKLEYNEAYKEYGYKVPKMKVATEYSYLFDGLSYVGSKPIPHTDIYGNVISRYLVDDDDDGVYSLIEYKIGADGMFIFDVDGNLIIERRIETNCELVDTNRYAPVEGTARFEVSNNGRYLLRYVLKDDQAGQYVQVIDYETDENGNYVIDQGRSVVTVEIFETVTGIEFTVESDENGALKVSKKDTEGGISYKVNWTIDSSVLPVPVFDESLMKQYTGETIYAKDVLKDFMPEFMEIVEGGEGIVAGVYTAKIRITTSNSKWDPTVTTGEFVYVTWRIDTVKADLSEIKWVFHDGTNTYDNSSSFVYTRVKGSPVVYWVELANVPEVLRSRLTYTTNNVEGAYAGINAGKYVTTYSFDIDENFEALDIPEGLPTTITWNIQRRALQIPNTTSVFMIFDRAEHNLLEILGVPSDWNEYYDIEVQYSNGGDFVPYQGHNGEKYMAYDSGAYKFIFTIHDGINTSATNPNVVWFKKALETKPEVPDPDEGEEPGESEEPGEGEEPGETPETPETPEVPETPEAPEAPETFEVPEGGDEEEVAVALSTEEVIDTVKASKEATNNMEALQLQNQVVETLAEEQTDNLRNVCDRIKQLACGAEVQLKSYRKYGMRGTL